jgi:hypothetical protein
MYMVRRGDLDVNGAIARMTTPSWMVLTTARAARAQTEYDSIQCHLAKWLAVDSIVALGSVYNSQAINIAEARKVERPHRK